jgi:ABC-type transport system involved in multi-copper enzyme maturation permease subunit
MRTQLHTTGLLTLTWFSAKKLIVHRRWVIALLIAILVGAVMGYFATEVEEGITAASDLLNILVLFFFMPILALIYGASMIRNEIDDRSITQVLTSPMDRRLSYLGYYFALALVLALLLIMVTTIGWACFFAVKGFDAAALELLLGYLLTVCIGALVYSALFLVFGVVLRHPIYLGLFYVFVWEDFVGSIPGAAENYTIRHHLLVVASTWIDYGDVATVSGSAGISAMVLFGITVALLAIGSWVFWNKEVP